VQFLDSLITHILPLGYQLSIPIALAAIAATISERLGVINLGIEGQMLVGAFAAVVGSHLTGSPVIGILFGMIAGGVFGLLHVTVCVKLRSNQAVCGVAINLLALGLTDFLTTLIWGTKISALVTRLPNVTVPLLERIPIAGVFFRNQTVFFYLLPLIVAAAYIFFYKTRWGLRVMAIGHNPQAALSAGINVVKYRYVGLMIAGVLAGLGGAYLSVAFNNAFVSDMVAGRGFMGIASNIFGGWNPLGSFLASFLFAFAQSLRYYVAGAVVPTQITQMLPYAITLIVLIAVKKRSRAPEAMGVLE